jgi:hypothetical protein
MTRSGRSDFEQVLFECNMIGFPPIGIQKPTWPLQTSELQRYVSIHDLTLFRQRWAHITCQELRRLFEADPHHTLAQKFPREELLIISGHRLY